MGPGDFKSCGRASASEVGSIPTRSRQCLRLPRTAARPRDRPRETAARDPPENRSLALAEDTVTLDPPAAPDTETEAEAPVETPEPRVVAFANPTAGKGRVGRSLVALRERLVRLWPGIEFFITTAPGEAARILHGLPLPPSSLVISIGGDGTVHEIGTALHERQGVSLGVVPFGSGNDVALQLGMPRDPFAALEAIRDGEPLPWDLGVLGPYTFLNTVGFALSAETCYWSHRTGPLTGLARYGVAVARAWWTHESLTLGIDGMQKSGTRMTTLIEIGIGDRSGGGFRLTTKAQVDDGLLDVCLVDALPRWQIPLVAPKARDGRHLDHPAVTYEQLSSFRIQLPQDTRIHVDGEIRTLGKGEHSVRVRPRALQIVVAPDHPRTIAARAPSLPEADS